MLAERACAQGNAHFGAVLALNDKNLAEAVNETAITKDKTLHAELNLISDASRHNDKETLSQATLYASTEPCAMCAGAIYWAGIKRVIYGCSIPRQIMLSGKALGIRIHDVLSGETDIEIIGPILEDEAATVYM